MASSVVYYSSRFDAEIELFIQGFTVTKALWVDTGEMLTKSQKDVAIKEYYKIKNTYKDFDEATLLEDPEKLMED